MLHKEFYGPQPKIYIILTWTFKFLAKKLEIFQFSDKKEFKENVNQSLIFKVKHSMLMIRQIELN